VPIVGPHIGAILGAFIYIFLVELHWDSEEELSHDFVLVDNETTANSNFGKREKLQNYNQYMQ